MEIKEILRQFPEYKRTCSIINPKDKAITYALKIGFLKKSNYGNENLLIITNKSFQDNSTFKKMQDKFINAKFIFVEAPLIIFLSIHNHFYSRLLPQQWFNNPTSKNGAFFGENVKIGQNTVIYPGTVIYDDVEIGNNCIIHANCSIGGDGFRFARFPDKSVHKIIHIANPGVIIGDNVEIQCNSNVSRGIFDPTIIGNNTKIDTFVHIGHNCIIGENNIITSHTNLGGSNIIGDNNWFGLSCTTTEHLIIGNNNFIGLGAKVVANLKDNENIAGFYGVPHKKWQNWWRKEFLPF